MAITIRYAPRRAHVPYLWFLATAAAALIAIGPIVAAVLVSFAGGGPTRTAFATAPAGNYAVVVRAEAAADTVVVVPAGGSDAIEVATVERLPGYTAYGAVAPDGGRVALVTADAGTSARPAASLVVVELASGNVVRLAEDLDYLQTPVWSNDGTGIVVTRTASVDGAGTTVDLVRVAADGSGETVVAHAAGVLGAYPVGFDTQGRLVHVVIGREGSVAYRDGASVATLAAGITRDWRLSPDGSALAFIETSTAAGVQYLARTVSLDGAGGESFGLIAASGESLGVAWRPGAEAATFGTEPGAGPGERSRALTASGFDIPLGYSGDGEALAVQQWTGASFDAPGDASLAIVGPNGERTALEGFSRFYGWATR